MKALRLSHLLQILTCILLLTPSFSKDDRKLYIVYMGEYPKDMEITDSFHTSMVQSVLGSKFASDTLLHRYKTFNGFVASLTKEESERMKGMDGVVSVIPERVYSVQTSRSWDFLNFPENVPRTNVESNTIVGVIDSGIWANSGSFTDGGFGPPPQKWKGKCDNFTCNYMCIDNSLNGALVRGKIVLCDGYYPSERVGFASGAAGVIFSSTLPLVAADVFALPAMHISANDGQSVYNYLKSTSNPAAIISKSYEGIDSAAPYIAPFSSRATPLNPALNSDAEFAYGAGQINPLKAVNPGLVYDLGPNDYINFLCGQGYSTVLLRRITGDNNTCTSANRGSVFNLNLPSFALATARSSYNDVTYGRTVTNVGSARSTYRAIISGYPSSLNIQVVPNVLTFTSVGQSLSFTVRIQGTINANLDSFSLTWDDGTHQVRSPIVVYVP
ncbi:hypothetical protein ACSQ67_017302 [Phaseolus vulgaris]